MSQTPPPPPPPQKEPESGPDDTSQVDGVLIQIEKAEDGEETVSIQPLGAVKRRELPGLLGIARKVSEAGLGIERG